MAKLTAKQQRFVEEYLIDLNATQAAIRAGYKAGNSQRASEIGNEYSRKLQFQKRFSRQWPKGQKGQVSTKTE